MTIYINNLYLGEIEPSTSIAGSVDIFEKVWPDPQGTINRVESEVAKNNIYWKQAETLGHGAKQKLRTNKVLDVSHLAHVADNPVLQNVHNQFNMLLLSTSNSYAVRYGLEENFYHEGYNLLKYSEGEEYKSHYDDTGGIGRVLSALVYLNDDFEGGETEFVNFGIKIKPRAGMLVLFPSDYSYRHISHPVTKGTKYALVTWIRSIPV